MEQSYLGLYCLHHRLPKNISRQESRQDWRGKIKWIKEWISVIVLWADPFLSFTECVDSYQAIHGGHLVDPSEAECVDCCVPQPLLSDKIFPCIHNIGGLCSNKSYPSSQGQCMNNSCTAVAKVFVHPCVPMEFPESLIQFYQDGSLFILRDDRLSFQNKYCISFP